MVTQAWFAIIPTGMYLENLRKYTQLINRLSMPVQIRHDTSKIRQKHFQLKQFDS
jgi:hypothetical protein